jgi:hypothetical protein
MLRWQKNQRLKISSVVVTGLQEKFPDGKTKNAEGEI